MALGVGMEGGGLEVLLRVSGEVVLEVEREGVLDFFAALCVVAQLGCMGVGKWRWVGLWVGGWVFPMWFLALSVHLAVTRGLVSATVGSAVCGATSR